MKGLIFTITSHGYDRIWAECIRSQESFAKRHGYEYRHIAVPSHLTHDSVAWSKLYFLQYFVKNSHYDWIMYIDADCMIQDRCPVVEQIIDTDHVVRVAPGYSGRINSGVIIVKSEQQAYQLLDMVTSMRGKALPQQDHVAWIYGGGENGHVIFCRKDHPQVGLLDHKRNNNHTPSLPDYIRHYSSGSPVRAGYRMPWKSRLAYMMLMIPTYTHKVLRKLGLLDDNKSFPDQDLNEVVESICVKKSQKGKSFVNIMTKILSQK